MEMVFPLLLIFIAVTAQSSAKLPAEYILRRGIISAGNGYSSDTGHITKQNCYLTNITVSGFKSHLAFDKMVTASDVANALGVSVGAEAGIGLFSVGANANYAKEIENDDLSISVNYLTSISQTVTVQIVGYGEDVLTNIGKAIYQNGTNPEFGVRCGDHFIETFEQGAILAMNMRMKFSSVQEKESFGIALKASYGPFGALAEIEKSAKEHKSTDSVSVRAYQFGGNTDLIPQALHNNIVDCDTNNIQACNDAIKGLIEYSANEFSSNLNAVNMQPLGLSEDSLIPITSIGLKLPKVNYQISKVRDELVHTMQKYKYLEEKLSLILQPSDLVIIPSFLENVKLLLDIVERNIDILTDEGAICWNSPSICLQTKRNIDKKLKPITAQDLTFLDGIKYVYVEQPLRGEGITLTPCGHKCFNNNQVIERFYGLWIHETSFKYRYYPAIFESMMSFWRISISEFDRERLAMDYDCNSNDGGNTYLCTKNFEIGAPEFERELTTSLNTPFPHYIPFKHLTKIVRIIHPLYFEI